MSWHVQFRRDSTDQVSRFPTPETAIAAACELMDEGCPVSGIGTGPLSDTIAPETLVRIYAIWTRAKRPLGLPPH